MAKTKKILTNDIISGGCGLLLTWVGIGGVNDEVRGVRYGWGWQIGVALIVFGIMIMGVAINRISNSLVGKSKLPNTARQGKK